MPYWQVKLAINNFEALLLTKCGVAQFVRPIWLPLTIYHLKYRIMKTKFLFLIMLLVSTLSFGQKNSRVEVEYSYMQSIFLEHEKIGNVTHSEFFGINRIGLFYNRKLYKWLRAEAGFNFMFSDYTTKFQATPNSVERDDAFFMICFPVVLSVEFLRYFYVKGGATVDFQTNEPKHSDKQLGIGSLFGFGVKYDYKDYTFSVGIDNQIRRISSFTKLENRPNYLHQYGVVANFGYNF